MFAVAPVRSKVVMSPTFIVKDAGEIDMFTGVSGSGELQAVHITAASKRNKSVNLRILFLLLETIGETNPL